MKGAVPERLEGRRQRLATALLSLVGVLFLIGAIGAESVELFTDLVFVRTEDGREYLVGQHRSLLPFEEEGFVILHRSGEGEAWTRSERRSGGCGAVATREGRLLVHHGAGYSLYEQGERVAYRDLPLEWSVRTAAPRGDELHVFGIGRGALEEAILAGPALRFSRLEDPDAPRGRRFRTVADGERFLLFWNDRAPGPDTPWRLRWTTVEAGRFGEVRTVEFEPDVEDFDVVRTGEAIRFYVYAGPDDERQDVLYQATWEGGRLVDARRLELPGERFLGRRTISVAADAAADGSVQLYLSTFGAIESFRIDPSTAAATPEDDVVALSAFARERVLLWLAGLGLVSVLLFLTGVRMFHARFRQVPSPVEDVPADPPRPTDPVQDDRERED